MKVAIPCHLYHQSESGIAAYVRELIGALDKKEAKNEYDLFVTSNKDFSKLSYKCRIIQDPTLYRNPLFDIFWHQVVLPSKNYDVVHIPTIRRIPYRKTCPVIATIHDMAPFVMKGKYGTLRQFYHEQILSKLVSGLDHVVTVSQNTKNDIVKYIGYPEEKISVIYPGINTEIFKPLPKKNDLSPFFVYVSRLEHPAKNHIKLIEAFELFKRRHSTPHQLLLAGPNSFGSEVIHQRIQKSFYRRDIQTLGHVSQEKIVDLYSNCDIMIYPSLYEGFGFPVLEAMACGAKVACSSTSSLGEIAKGRAILFNPNDSEEICEALEKGPHQELKGAIEYVHRFQWHTHAQKVLALYDLV